jgi:hypothetical protein
MWGLLLGGWVLGDDRSQPSATPGSPQTIIKAEVVDEEPFQIELK